MITLQTIQDGDVVRYRTGRAGQTDVDWNNWKTGPFYIVRRENKINRSHPRQSYQKNAIIIITPRSDVTAEFSIDDLGTDSNEIVFCCEDYYLQLDIPRE